jgi:hypothetical protein
MHDPSETLMPSRTGGGNHLYLFHADGASMTGLHLTIAVESLPSMAAVSLAYRALVSSPASDSVSQTESSPLQRKPWFSLIFHHTFSLTRSRQRLYLSHCCLVVADPATSLYLSAYRSTSPLMLNDTFASTHIPPNSGQCNKIVGHISKTLSSLRQARACSTATGWT